MSHLLVTGGAGFIGSNFVRYWRTQHPEDTITVLDALTYAGIRENIADLEGEQCRFVHGDIRNMQDVERAAQGVDTIVHFAAESHVDRSILGPSVFLETNILGTSVLLEYARTHDHITRFHHVSTDEVYGSLPLEGDERFNENSPHAPRSPYSASKSASDELVMSYFHTYHLPVTISNCSNNYGPYHFPEKFIPLMIVNTLMEQPVPVYGQGVNVRDWLHVEDHCRAIEAILLRGTVGETYCVGGDEEWKNIDVAKKVLELMDAPLSRITFVEDRKGHDLRYAIDSSKIQRELGWKPQWTFDSGLRSTIDWFKANESWWRALLERRALKA